LLIKTKIVGSHTADSEPVKQEANGTVILPPLVFPGQTLFFGLNVSEDGSFISPTPNLLTLCTGDAATTRNRRSENAKSPT
jgi:hypothetical protein